jgi:hypothetical protein
MVAKNDVSPIDQYVFDPFPVNRTEYSNYIVPFFLLKTKTTNNLEDKLSKNATRISQILSLRYGHWE